MDLKVLCMRTGMRPYGVADAHLGSVKRPSCGISGRSQSAVCRAICVNQSPRAGISSENNSLERSLLFVNCDDTRAFGPFDLQYHCFIEV